MPLGSPTLRRDRKCPRACGNSTKGLDTDQAGLCVSWYCCRDLRIWFTVKGAVQNRRSLVPPPAGPLGGLKLRSCGLTRNDWLLVSVPLGVVTVTKPVVAPAGTVAPRNVSETMV